MNPTTTLYAIQAAVAPVFLLAAVAGMIGTLASRLARIIDRARDLEDRIEAETVRDVAFAFRELDVLKRRGRICNASIGLLTICGVLIGVTVMEMFLYETSLPTSGRLVPFTFLGAIGSFVSALLLFLYETRLATHALRFGRGLKRPGSE